MRNYIKASSVFILALATFDLAAMDIKVCADQMILSGRVEGIEYRQVSALLDENPNIKVAVLRNSPGGDARTGYLVGELFRDKKISTYVSGYCQSSCSRFFLGGVERYFTNDYRAGQTRVAFHGNYLNDGLLPRAHQIV
jgi:ATP-dependent protease ClpP protease subunit